MGRIKHENKNEDVGFQIAPMIDVVFVIMLFFMVKAGDRQKETEIKSKLPGNADVSTALTSEPMEETITIDEGGVIALNEDILDPGNVPNSDLKKLKDQMMRLAEQSKNTKVEPIVTVSTQPDTKYSRVVDVLNAIGHAGIKNMTFSVGGDE